MIHQNDRRCMTVLPFVLHSHDAGLSWLPGFVTVCLFIHALINTKPRDRLWGPYPSFWCQML